MCILKNYIFAGLSQKKKKKYINYYLLGFGRPVSFLVLRKISNSSLKSVLIQGLRINITQLDVKLIVNITYRQGLEVIELDKTLFRHLKIQNKRYKLENMQSKIPKKKHIFKKKINY